MALQWKMDLPTILVDIPVMLTYCCTSMYWTFTMRPKLVKHLNSATGTITLLPGQPKEGVSVEARSESKGYYEETTTDSSGYYRLRGLVPDTTYLIKVVKKDDLGSSSHIERASPESFVVKVSCVALFAFWSCFGQSSKSKVITIFFLNYVID